MTSQRGGLVSLSAAVGCTGCPSCQLLPATRVHRELVKHDALSASPARRRLKEMDPKILPALRFNNKENRVVVTLGLSVIPQGLLYLK